MDDTAQTALRQWLSGEQFDWYYFFTATFRNPVLPHAGESAVMAARATLAQHHPGHMFIGMELHRLGTVHLHGLLEKPELSGNGPIKYVNDWGIKRDTWQHLFHRFGRADVQYVREKEAVANYCTKYVTKALAWYDIW